MYDEVKQIIDKNYTSLNDRIKVIEKKSSKFKSNNDSSSNKKKIK